MDELSISDPQSWNCAICQELLYKPVANVCGHLFCFWCAHKAMSPFSVSKCPLCRAQYGHFPAIANKLHCFLKASFPEQYASRASEVVTEEEESDVASPETTVPLVLHSSPGKPSWKDFTCDYCSKVVFMPIILNCGHMVCSTPECRGTLDDGCPCCHAHPTGKQSAVCAHVWDLMKCSFREECESRAREVSEVSGIDPESLMIASPRTAMLCKSRQEDTDIHDMYPSDLNDMLDRTFGGADTSTTEGVERMATRFLTSWLDKSDYPHFGVGCDACGQYPILGKRYKCTDCPESVGFDICGTCYDRGVGDVLGRFNQRHTPDHHLELVPPSITKLHVLKAMHPELDFDKLLSLIEMSWEDEGGASGPSNTRNPSAPDSEAHEEGASLDHQMSQSTQEQINNSEDSNTLADGSRMMRARGPRPTFDHQQ
ncbi:hypothetical protein M9434_006533 [Picochlorum sp. BPE23]|nr:hypothetical protein M9434_006533 [Picochlorum sp. BPE23]